MIELTAKEYALLEYFVRHPNQLQAENIHMTRLVNDLLTLARADAGQVSLEARDVDMSDVALEVVERIAPLARQKGVTLVCGDLLECKVTGDRLYLMQMLTNLVENAIKYTYPYPR